MPNQDTATEESSIIHATEYLFAAMKARCDHSTTKLVLIMLANRANREGRCWPSIKRIAVDCECSITTVKDHLGHLEGMGYIQIQNRFKEGFKTSNCYQLLNPTEMRHNGKEPGHPDNKNTPDGRIPAIDGRIPANSWSDSGYRNTQETPNKQVLHKGGRFVVPDRVQVEQYATTLDKQIDGQQFVDFYESKGWMVGKNKMKSWQAAVRNWIRREDKPNQPQTRGRGDQNLTRNRSLADDLNDTSWAK